MKPTLRTILISSSTMTFFLLVALVAKSNQLIVNSSSSYIYSDTALTPKKRVGLVLGTSKLTTDSRSNLYFKYRVSATVDLYKSGKISKILVSGDNGQEGYDEPTDIKVALLQAGIPETDIYLDYAGFRTLDSIVRAKKIFGLDELTIISQQFHVERALFIANHYSINAIGYSAKDVKGVGGIKTNLREKLARVKTILDLYVLQSQPRFLGKTIPII